MTLLKSQEYIDLVELDRVMHNEYGWPKPGHSGSFHRVYTDYFYTVGSGQMTSISLEELEMDAADGGSVSVAPELLEAFKKLISDGRLPKRDEYNIYVWW